MRATSHFSQRGSCSTSASRGPTTSGSAPVVMRSRRWAVGSLNPADEAVLMSADPVRDGGSRLRRAGTRGEPAADLALVVQRVAELLFAHDDAAKEPVRRVLLRERDASEHLQRAVGDLACGSRD